MCLNKDLIYITIKNKFKKLKKESNAFLKEINEKNNELDNISSVEEYKQFVKKYYGITI